MSTFQVPNFEAFLQKCLDCKQLVLVDLVASRLIASGENYGSLMIKLDAKIKKGEGVKEEMLYLVGKTNVPSNDPIVDWAKIFKKEVFMYVEIHSAFQNLERGVGIESVLNAWPKYIGHRCSLNGGEDVVDEHSILVMENLKHQNYYIGDKSVGLDFEHAKLALTFLARFHSLGIALEQKRPDLFKKLVIQAQVTAVDFSKLDEGFDAVLKTFRETPCLTKHLPIIEKCFAGAINGGIYNSETNEPWVTITHGDFWTNNMMFHKDKNGHVDDFKFVDFQMFLCNSPIKDLPLFISTCLDEQTKANRMDDLLKLYYDNFLRHLERLGCHVSAFTREAFNKELKYQALILFPLSAFALKFFDYKVSKDEEGKLEVSDVMRKGITDTCLKRWQELVDIYEKRGWF